MIHTRWLLLVFAMLAGLSVFIISGKTWLNKSSQEHFAGQLTVTFNQDIRPILNEHCLGCHGGVSKQGGISFIREEEALARGHSGRLVIVPGNPNASELIARIESNDASTRMPYKAAALSQEKIETLRLWIKQGAVWEDHWAFVAPVPQPVPAVSRHRYVENEIDHFIQAKLARQQLAPAKRADKKTLLRRVFFDLVGLPPSPQDIDAFIRDDSPQAYERQVEQLLESPRFGEHWASMWLDLARYADSQGYTRDEYRDAWPYRDWVIEAFNQNLSYRDFIIKQLAGDLLPDRTLSDVVATGFHRQTPINSEGGTDDEEFRVVAMMDRVATTWSVLNGVTMNCVQCHSHPYDPIDQEEYYKFYSVLNTTQDADKRDDTPMLRFAKHQNQRDDLFLIQEQIHAIRHAQAQQANELAGDSRQWSALAIVEAQAHQELALRQLLSHAKQQLKRAPSRNKKNLKKIEERIQELEKNLKEIRLRDTQIVDLDLQQGELYMTGSVPAVATYKTQTVMQPSEHEKTIHAIKLTAMPFNPKQSVHSPEWAFSIDDIRFFFVNPKGERRPLSVDSYFSNSLEVMDEQLTYLGSGRVKKASAFYAQRLFYPRWTVAVLSPSIRLSAGSRIDIELDQLQSRNLNEGKPSELRRLKIEVTDSMQWLMLANSPSRKHAVDRYAELLQAMNKIDHVSTPVMFAQAPWEARQTAMFGRGNFLNKVEPTLTPGTPKIFPPIDKHQPIDRLTMAQWFFHPQQPLTARVAVNRFWFHLFNQGLVESMEDFGSSGRPPSHPALLDWLAITFQSEMNWDMKALLKLIVTSYAYQQQARQSHEHRQRDPSNQWLARGPRKRLSAEMIRDQALKASGLLNHQLGGQPVMPPQPQGIWGRPGRKIKDWQTATDNKRYRRAIYTFIKRAYIYPSFLTFDMETREISHARRYTTNTPLQALVTLNDPVYHEAAKALAQQMIQVQQANLASNSSAQLALQTAANAVLSRKLTEGEMTRLIELLEQLRSQNHDGDEYSVWTALASVFFNLDAALTR